MNTFGDTENCYLNHQRCLNLGLIPVYTMGRPEHYELPSFYVKHSERMLDRARERWVELHASKDPDRPDLDPDVVVTFEDFDVEWGRSWEAQHYQYSIVMELEYLEEDPS